MSVTFDLLCVRCGERAPEVGDFGYIGSPSLWSHARLVPWRPQRFGYIYRGLAAVSLLPAEVEAFRAFLLKHRGHGLFGAPGDDDNDGGGVFATARTWISIGLSLARHPTVLFRRGLEGTLELFVGGLDDEPPDIFAFVSEGDYVQARYRMACRTCDRSVITENWDLLRRFQPRQLRPVELDIFARRVLALDADDIYHATPVIDPAHDLRPFREFVREHRQHQVEAEAVPETMSA